MKRAFLTNQTQLNKNNSEHTSFRTRVLRLFALTTALLFAAALPAIAEAPIDELDIDRENNVRKLVLLNRCIGCDLSGVTLTEAHLIGADLRDANLRFANLTGSNLEGADLAGADLTGANLTNAFLTNASLANATLDGVNFSGAYLYYVDVTGASTENLNLTGAQLLETPIYVGGDELPLDEAPPEQLIPFDFPTPLRPIEPLLDPIL